MSFVAGLIMVEGENFTYNSNEFKIQSNLKSRA